MNGVEACTLCGQSKEPTYRDKSVGWRCCHYATCEERRNLPKHHCCQCGSVGEVANRYAKSEQPPVPITWVCATCKRHVCINCTLTIARFSSDRVPRDDVVQ